MFQLIPVFSLNPLTSSKHPPSVLLLLLDSSCSSSRTRYLLYFCAFNSPEVFKWEMRVVSQGSVPSYWYASDTTVVRQNTFCPSLSHFHPITYTLEYLYMYVPKEVLCTLTYSPVYKQERDVCVCVSLSLSHTHVD